MAEEVQDSSLLTNLEQALASLSIDDYQDILSEIDPVSWTETFRILKGKKFSFNDRNYLLQIYRDESQHILVYKGRQVEMSEFVINWLSNKLWRHPYTNGLHVFPRDGQCLRFSKLRIDPAIKGSTRMTDWYDERGSEARIKKFSKQGSDAYNFYILGGVWESRKDTVGDAARGMSVDFIAYDERQDHPNDVETVVGEAASHSDYKQSLTLGTPKMPGIQFDQQWEVSDKHYWMVTCKHCGSQEPVTMDNIMMDGDDYYYGCTKCKMELDRTNGIWLPTNPQKRPYYRGYHISQLMVRWLTANEIMAKYNSPHYSKRRFYNEVLGIAYGGDDVPITDAMMDACTENNNSIGMLDVHDIYVGIDWGNTSYMILQSPTSNGGFRLIDAIIASESDPREHPKKFARQLRKYSKYIRNVVNDAGPDITRHNNLKDELKENGIRCPVWACYYTNPPAKVNVQWNKNEGYVTAGRSEMIDNIIDEISDQLFEIPGNDKYIERIQMMMDHFTNIMSVKKQVRGMDIVMYENTGPDHFLHAKLYANVAGSTGTGTVVSKTLPPMKQAREIQLAIDRLQNRIPTHHKNSSIFPKFGKRRGK